MKSLIPVRLLRNKFFEQIFNAESNCASREEIQKLLGKGRAKKGIFEGDLAEGELEIGQAASLIDNILPVSEIMKNFIDDFQSALIELQNPSLYQFE